MGSAAQRHVALIGFMGSGKTTVGALLAAMLGRPFVDTDALVVARTGRSIPEIFADEGEAAFRDYEGQALAEALAGPPAVIATGGGLIVREGNWRLLSERAFTVWLHVPLPVLAERLAGSRDRPLLAGGPDLERMQRLYAAREPLYARARLRVDATAPPERVAQEIYGRLAEEAGGAGETSG